MRAAEFSDLRGLIQGLSTGVQGELDKLAKRAERLGRSGRRAGCCGWRRGRRFWPGGRTCWPSWMPGWAAVMAPGRGWWRCAGWAVRARPAWRWSTRTGTWARSGWPGSSRPRTRRCWRRVRRAGRPARGRGSGPRDPVAAVHGVLAAYRRGWLLVFDNAPDRASVARVRAAGRARAGADHQPERAVAAGAGPGGAGAGPGVAAGFLVDRTGDADGQAAAGAGRGGGRAAAGAGAGRRLHPGHRGQPGRVPGLVPAAAGGPAGPRRAGRVRRDGGHHLGAGVRPAGGVRARARRGCCGCWRSARPRRSRCGLLLQPRPGLAEPAEPGGGAGAGAVAGGSSWPPGMRSPRCAGIRWSRPAGDGSVSVHRLVQAVTADQMPAELRAGVAAGRRRPDRGRDPRRPALPADLAGVRGAAAARPGGPARRQRRHVRRSRATSA